MTDQAPDEDTTHSPDHADDADHADHGTAGPASTRIFRHEKVLLVTPHAHQVAAELLAEAAAQLTAITAVVGIAHGGTASAAVIGDLLRVPVLSIRARHNLTDDPYTQATGHVTLHGDGALSDLGQEACRPGTVLVIDDICGSGATLTTVTAALRAQLPPESALLTGVMCLNGGATTRPDLWVWAVEDWVVFPWEAQPASTTPTRTLTVPGRVSRS